MKIPKQIEAAIAAQIAYNDLSPTNLFQMSEKDIRDLGYKPLKAVDEFQNGDLLCAAPDTNGLWILITDASYTRGSKMDRHVGERNIWRKA